MALPIIDRELIDHMCSIVQRGALPEAHCLAELLEREGYCPRGGEEPDELRAHFMSYISMLGLAAERGGLETAQVYRHCDAYFERMRSLTTREEVRRALKELLLSLTALTAALREQPGQVYYFHRVAGYVATHLYGGLTTADIAKAMGVSRGYLSEAFHRESGELLSGYIRRKKVEEACRLLRGDALSIGEIGERLGFSSQSHLTRVFRRQLGVTPFRYRQRFRGEGESPSS